MIVKDESSIIEKTLNNLCSYITFAYWVICDTGSTDNTCSIIIDFFNKKNIPGELCYHTWKDFGSNRTLALEAAYNKTEYLLIFDADDSINGNFKLPKLIDDKYNLFFGSNACKYVRPLLINNRKKWHFKGILHEYLEPLEPIKPEKTIEGDYFIISGREGNRNKNPNKYLNDAILLEKEINHIITSKNNNDLLPRYTYYCAQSFRDANNSKKAIFYYTKVLEYDTWIQEKYNAALTVGNLYQHLNNIEEALIYWYKAITYDKERREAVLKIMDYYFEKKNYFALYCLHEQIKDFTINNISTKLFLDNSRAHDNHFLNSIAACYISEWMSGYYSCKYLILNNIYLEITLNNFKCYAYNIHLDPDNKSFLDKLLIIFDSYLTSKQDLIKELWTIISKNYKSYSSIKFKYLNNKYLFLSTNNQDKDLQNDFAESDDSNKLITKCSLQQASKKILIWTGFSTKLWNETYINNNAIGGSEKAVSYVAKHLPKEYQIYISGDVEDEVINNITYINRNKLQKMFDDETFHTIIVSRYVSFFFMFSNIKCYQLYLMLHDTCLLNNFTDLAVNTILETNNKYIDKAVCLTEWHVTNTIIVHPILKNKIAIINNGIDTNKLKIHLNQINKTANKFVWTSSSARGLIILLNLWEQIIKAIPDASLDIASYEDFPKNDNDFKMLEIINKNPTTIKHHGKLNSTELYNLISTAEYWLYTTTFYETSCITALEMLGLEVICLYYPLGGLVNTMNNYGIQVNSGTEIQTILDLNNNNKLKNKIKKKGKAYALSCSWENRAKEWSTLLGLNKPKWIFYCSPNYGSIMIEQYIYNLNIIYPDYNISLTTIKNDIIIAQPKKVTLVYNIMEPTILSELPNTEFSFLNTEPLNLEVRLSCVVNILKEYPNLNYYDYSNSNLKILEENNITVKNKHYLPYKCGTQELSRLIYLNKNTEKQYDFGIILGASAIHLVRREKVIDFLKNNYSVHIIAGWYDDRDIELAKCKYILNIHGSLYSNDSNIFEHIRCDRLLAAGFNVLSETSYKLDQSFIDKYKNLTIINYNDFFNKNIIKNIIIK
jgi:tetratricopeptide (TPR) repeat protein